MKMNALVMSRNAGSLKVLVGAFAELGMEYRVLLSASEAIETLNTSQHSALLVDFEVPRVLEVVKTARALSAGGRPLLFALIGKRQATIAAFQVGANFVLHKPLDLPQVLHCFRLANELLEHPRPEPPAHEIETLAYFELPQGTVSALVYALTGDGLSVRAGEPLIPQRGVAFRLLLPGTTQVVRGTGDFVWSDKYGRGGLFIRHMPTGCRRDLTFWMNWQRVKRLGLIRNFSGSRRNRLQALAPRLH
ncbi:MAG: hypothetical protein JOZ14_08710 [Acidobacteria bacterium]|nr:hypothetical protein [Acidobacteriota bacterium]